ncbi:MAG: hypothetical protein ACI9KE_003696, partial [Polyangiales bacterium]
MARSHHHHFAKTVLPQLFFAAPGQTIASLLGPNGESFLFQHWNAAAAAVGESPLPHVDQTPLVAGGPPEPHSLEALGISQVGAHQVVFIAMPAALEPNEALFVALVSDGTTPPSVYFYERCSAHGVGGTVPHDSETVLAMLRPGSRANCGFFEGLTLTDFRAALSRNVGMDIPSPVQVSAPQSPMAPEVDKGAPLFPLLKAKDWHAKALALTMPLPGITHPDAPCVAFARNMDDQYVILTLQEAGDANPQTVFDEAVKNLSAKTTDLAMVQGVAVCGGSDFAADRLVDPNFISAVQQQLGSNDLYICAPHRRAIYAISTNAAADTKALFAGMVSTEITRTPPPGAPVSDLVFRVMDGQLTAAHRLEEIAKPGLAQTQNNGGGEAYGLARDGAGGTYGLPRGGAGGAAYGFPRDGADETPGGHDNRKARAAGIASMVALFLSALSSLFFEALFGRSSVGGIAFWVACGFLMRLPAARPAAIVTVISSFVGIGAGAFIFDYAFGFHVWILGAVATVTWGSFAWALGKACSPPKVGVGATCAVVAISLLWMPLLW